MQMSGAWEKWQQVYADLKFANRHGRWSNPADAEQEAVDGMGEVAVHCCRDGSSAVHDGRVHEQDAEACRCLLAWEKWQQVYADLKFANRQEVEQSGGC